MCRREILLSTGTRCASNQGKRAPERAHDPAPACYAPLVRFRAVILVALGACYEGVPGGGADSTTEASVGTTLPSGTAAQESSVGGNCPPALVDCGGCVALQSDVQHCGECDHACNATEMCIDGACAATCEDAAAPDACGGLCTDLDTDPVHCGACDKVCPAGASCSAGGCVCPGDLVACAAACVDPARDEGHCGGCDAPCATGQPCLGGQCVAATVHHILITGQSLSEGYASSVVSTEQPYDNLMFAQGVRAGGTGLSEFVPLAETQNGSWGETIASGSANLLHELVARDGFSMRVLASCHGVSGAPYSAIKKGTAAYANGMAQVNAGAMISGAQDEVHAVRAVAVIHGESDHIAGNAAYDQDLLEWQSDYETDTQALTGQALPVPMFYCQVSSFTAYGDARSAIPGLQLAAAAARPESMFVVGPKYFLPYSDGIHLTGEGEQWLGEYYAKAFSRVLVAGERWIPLRPQAATRDATTISIAFDVPVPPLVLDEALVDNPGFYGFEFTDDSGDPPAIEDVVLINDTTVEVELAAEPIGENPRIRYAWTGTPDEPAGPQTGARGNLRDSDSTPSRFGYPLFNWAVHFELPVR